MNTRKILLSVVAACLSCYGLQAQSVTVFDDINISGTKLDPGGVGPIGGADSGAEAFTTGSDSLSLSSVALELAKSTGAASTMTVTLESSVPYTPSGNFVAAGLPGAALDTIFSGSVSTLGLTAAPKAITFSGLNYTLSPNTTYWISVDFPNYPTAGANWYYDDNSPAPASDVATQTQWNAYANNQHDPNWDSSYTVQPLMMTVLATDLSAVPEPTTSSLMIMAAGAGFQYLRKRKATKA